MKDILFGNMKQQMDNMIAQCQQANAIVLEHLQNAVSATDRTNKVFENLWLGRAFDAERLAREMEVGEAIANRLIGELYKLPTPDYLLAIKTLADLILASKKE